MNFEGIIAIINLNQWFITAIMWSFLLMVSRAACAIAMKIFVVAGKSEGTWPRLMFSLFHSLR